jgi:spectinomycin phosphotransferase
MLTKPDIKDELIISRLQDEYNLHVSILTFLPIGADMGTAVYRVVADDGTSNFLKLRKGFDEISVTVPLFLKSQGIKEIIAPFETKSNQGWADFGAYKMILYPFIEGVNGFETEVTDKHKRIFGRALKGIHSAQIPPELKRQIPQETFSPQWRE